jgi:hypothetical protein
LTVRALTILLILGAALVGCTGATATAPPAGDNSAALVDSLEILLLESFPVQVHAVVKGSLPDGCTEIENASAARKGNTFDLTLTTRRTTDQPCTEALVPFEESVPLDVAGLAAGQYTVNVAGLSEAFSLDADNILAEATPQPVDLASIPWPEAQSLILSGEVAQIVQGHSLQVKLTLQDGSQVITVEPSIDEVLKVVEQCGPPCAGILVATE